MLQYQKKFSSRTKHGLTISDKDINALHDDVRRREHYAAPWVWHDGGGEQEHNRRLKYSCGTDIPRQNQ